MVRRRLTPRGSQGGSGNLATQSRYTRLPCRAAGDRFKPRLVPVMDGGSKGSCCDLRLGAFGPSTDSRYTSGPKALSRRASLRVSSPGEDSRPKSPVGQTFRVRESLWLVLLLLFGLGGLAGCSGSETAPTGAQTPAVTERIPLPDMDPEKPYQAVYETGIPVVRDTDPEKARLYVNIYRPRAEGRFPALLEAIAYRREIIASGDAPDPKWLAKRGYVVVLLDVRGTGSSEGTWGSFSEAEIEDVVWIIDHWIPEQPWSNGKVGMIGPSYMGIIQYLAAVRKPTHLKAIFPGVSMADAYRDIFYQGGIFNQEFILFWAVATVGLSLVPSTELLTDPYSAIKALAEHISSIPELLSWLQMTTDQTFFTERSPMSYWDTLADFPVLSSGGWFCIFTRGSLLNYIGLEQASKRNEPRNGWMVPKRVFMGPWYHASGALLLNLPSEVLHKRWFDWHLKADEDPLYRNYDILDPQYPVQLYVFGAEKWRKERTWPLERAGYQPLYLSGQKQPDDQNPSLNNGSLSWERGEGATGIGRSPVETGSTRIIHDPPHYAGQYSRSTCRWLVGVTSAYHSSEDERRNEKKTLTFTTARLERDIEVTGPVVLRLWARTRFKPLSPESVKLVEKLHRDSQGLLDPLLQTMQERNVHWVVNLNDVYLNGRVRNLTSGWLAASHRRDPARPDWTQPGYDPFDYPEDVSPSLPAEGQLYEYVIEIWPTSNLFKAGHQIRVDISNSDVPHLVPTLVPSESEILHDPEHPSRLILPVVDPGSTDPGLWIEHPRDYFAGEVPWDANETLQ